MNRISNSEIVKIITSIAQQRNWGALEKGALTYGGFVFGNYINIARHGIPMYIKEHVKINSIRFNNLYRLKYFKKLYSSPEELGLTKHSVINEQYIEFLDQCIMEILAIEFKKLGIYEEIKDYEFRFYLCKTAYIETINSNVGNIKKSKRIYKLKD